MSMPDDALPNEDEAFPPIIPDHVGDLDLGDDTLEDDVELDAEDTLADPLAIIERHPDESDWQWSLYCRVATEMDPEARSSVAIAAKYGLNDSAVRRLRSRFGWKARDALISEMRLRRAHAIFERNLSESLADFGGVLVESSNLLREAMRRCDPSTASMSQISQLLSAQTKALAMAAPGGFSAQIAARADRVEREKPSPDVGVTDPQQDRTMRYLTALADDVDLLGQLMAAVGD